MGYAQIAEPGASVKTDKCPSILTAEVAGFQLVPLVISRKTRELKERRGAFKSRSKPTQGPIFVEESAESR